MEPRVFVALDVDRAADAEALAENLSGLGLGFKLGPRLMLREGAQLVQKIGRHGPVFIDCKHLDIPSTMEAAVRAGFETGAQYTTIHALAGPEALKRMADVETEIAAEIARNNSERVFRILTVTVLTSFSKETLPFGLRGHEISKIVEGLAKDAKSLSAFVCSPQEAALLRQLFPQAFLVTPGIRPSGSAAGDQARVETPETAARAGASALVVGRPIIESKNPREIAQNILRDFEKARTSL